MLLRIAFAQCAHLQQPWLRAVRLYAAMGEHVARHIYTSTISARRLPLPSWRAQVSKDRCSFWRWLGHHRAASDRRTVTATEFDQPAQHLKQRFAVTPKSALSPMACAAASTALARGRKSAISADDRTHRRLVTRGSATAQNYFCCRAAAAVECLDS